MTARKPAGAKALAPKKQALCSKEEEAGRNANIVYRFADGSTLGANAVDLQVNLIRQWVAMEKMEDPRTQAAGTANLRKLAALSLGAVIVPAKRSQKAKDSADHRSRKGSPDALAEYALALGYPSKTSRKKMLLGAMEKFSCDQRTIERWLAEAKEKNLLT
jgi:hypothetical protein